MVNTVIARSLLGKCINLFGAAAACGHATCIQFDGCSSQ